MVLTNYYDEIKCNGNKWLLFNIYSGRVISVIDDMHRKLINGDFTDLSNEELSMLKKTEFIVPSHEYEEDRIKTNFTNMKYRSESLVVTILTNMDCNLGCKYCHENGLMDYSFLREPQIEKIKKWLDSQVKSGQYKNITIYFYGGEPTLNMHAVKSISEYVAKLSNENNLHYDLSMSTNGTLLNDDIVEQLFEVNVRDIQVTLDGAQKIHDYRKPFLDGKGTFDIILQNIKKYYKQLNFTVRANVDKNNYESIPELMDIIVKDELQNKVYFYLDLISSTHTKNDYCNNFVFTSIEEMASISYLWKEQKKKGIPLHGKNVIEGLCGNLSKSNVTISSTGNFYICPGLCGIKDACLGSLDNGYNSIYDKMMKTDVWKKCIKCKYLPMCAGGCRAQAYMKSGSCFECYCKKKYYESVVMMYIMYKYE